MFASQARGVVEEERRGDSSLPKRKKSVSLPTLGFALSLALSAIPLSGLASEPPGWTEPYEYVVVDQELRGVLKAFARNLSIRVQISDEIHGRVRGDLPKLPAGEFLEALARQFGFDWYYEGGVLYVSDASESQARMLILGPVAFSDLESELDNLKILDGRYPLRHSRDSNLAMVSGPPRYVALIEETLTALHEQVSSEVLVFRGRRKESS